MRISQIPNFYDYLHSIENEEKNIRHLPINSPELQKIRAMLGEKIIVKGAVNINHEVVAELCAEKGETITEVSANMGMGKTWLSSIFRGVANNAQTAQMIADYFNVDIEELLVE